MVKKKKDANIRNAVKVEVFIPKGKDEIDVCIGDMSNCDLDRINSIFFDLPLRHKNIIPKRSRKKKLTMISTREMFVF